MIINAILVVLKLVVNVLLLPLTALNVAIDFVASIPVVVEFLQVVAYILPWSNILPIIVLIVGIFGFRIVISLIKTIWSLIPFA